MKHTPQILQPSLYIPIAQLVLIFWCFRILFQYYIPRTATLQLSTYIFLKFDDLLLEILKFDDLLYLVYIKGYKFYVCSELFYS